MKKLNINKSRHNDALQSKTVATDWVNKCKITGISAVMTAWICAGVVPTYAADIEIYKVPEDSTGSATVMLMLDLSGSMGAGLGPDYSYGDYGVNATDAIPGVVNGDGNPNTCMANGTGSSISNDNGSTTFVSGRRYQINSNAPPKYIPYARQFCFISDADATTHLPLVADVNRGCEKVTGGYRCYNRLVRLKDGLNDVLRGTESAPGVDDRITMGLAVFGGDNGRIRNPAKELGSVTEVNTGQKIKGRRTGVAGSYQYSICLDWFTDDSCKTWETPSTSSSVLPTYDATTGTNPRYYYDQRDKTHRDNLIARINSLSLSGSTPTAYAYAEVAAYMMGTRATTPVSYYEAMGNSAMNSSDYYNRWLPNGCTSPTVGTLTGRGVHNGLTLNTARCTDEYYGSVPTDILNFTGGSSPNYGVFEYRHNSTTSRKMFYRLKDHAIMIGNAATNDSAYWQCNSNLASYENLTGIGVDSGKTLTIHWCDAETNTNANTPNAVKNNSDFSTFNGRRSNGSERKIYYRAVATPAIVTTDKFTGWAHAETDISVKDMAEDKYIAPTSISEQITGTSSGNAKKECSGQGIYFLTDGEPNEPGTRPNANGEGGTSYGLMRSALGSKGGSFSCANSQLGGIGPYANNGSQSWACIGNFAEALLDPNKNPVGLKIQTAVVGFNSAFADLSMPDPQDADKWAKLGGRPQGAIVGTNSRDVMDSINAFIKDVMQDIPSLSTGSSTIPADALMPEKIQSYAYFPQFEPKVHPSDTQQVWFGNLKKFWAVNNGIYENEDGTGVVVEDGILQDRDDLWSDADITYDENTPLYKKGGALSRLILGTTTEAGNTVAGRKLLTDYHYDGTKPQPVSKDLGLVRIGHTYTVDDGTKTDTTYAKALMSLLGYDIPSSTNTNGLDLSTTTANLRQMGSISHSLPILLTQEGKAFAEIEEGKVVVGTEDREDYILFGSTQGLVHVVDAETGIEKFSFLPKEMLETQSETLRRDGGNLAGGKDKLYYGMDGEWTAHTVYVTKPDGTLTVKGTERNVVGSATDKENLKGKQWVYGGMRMGGRSYYALDLTNINNPKVKFHIDPGSAKVYRHAFDDDGNSITIATDYPALEKMGQSWSKPKLAYINWQGTRKLVMFVGGGYDAGGTDGNGLFTNNIRTSYAGYESYNYNQTNEIGAAVYMFDADTGALLWQADKNLNTDIKYSIVSEIKTVDRNNDGVVDHIYFGDLAGQAFRVDFKNDGTATFATQATKILNLHQTDGTSPRFYLPPTFTAHRSAGKVEGGNIVVAAFTSGNKSSPLLATVDSPTHLGGKQNSVGLQYDAVYAVYDYDIFPNTQYYPTSHIAARTLATETDTTPDPTKLKLITNIVRKDSTEEKQTTPVKGAVVHKDNGWGGWYYRLNKKMDNSPATESVIKGLSPMIALADDLYVTMYDASDNGTTSSCGAGVKGHSFTKRLCLPTGVCGVDADYTYILGPGIVAPDVGGDDDCEGGNCISLYVPDPEKVCTGEDCSPCVGTECQVGKNFPSISTKQRFIPSRWYERYAVGE